MIAGNWDILQGIHTVGWDIHEGTTPTQLRHMQRTTRNALWMHQQVTWFGHLAPHSVAQGHLSEGGPSRI